MVMMTKLKHVDERREAASDSAGATPRLSLRFSARSSFRFPWRPRDGAALVVEQEILLDEYEKLVANAMRKAAGQGQLSSLEHWREAIAEAMMAAIKAGLMWMIDGTSWPKLSTREGQA